MKTTRSLLLLVLALTVELLVTSGCTNTARGMKQDTNNAAQKVENATR